MAYTTGSYRYGRILMSNFTSAPIPKNILTHPDFRQGIILKNQNIMRVLNINLFGNYVFEQDSLDFQGSTDIFNAIYSGITFIPETGTMKIIDTVFIDQSGTFLSSGIQTGIFQNEIITKISAGYNHSLYIDPFYGKYFGLGNTGNNRIGPQNINNIVQVEAGNTHSLLLYKNKTITGFGDNLDGRVAGIIEALNNSGWNNTPVGKLTGVEKISTKNSFSIALLGDNGVTGWGNNFANQLEPFQNKILYLSGIKDVKAGGSHGLILFDNGTLTGWGNQGTGNWINPDGWKNLNNILKISLGENHTIALFANSGQVTGWGDNSFGQISGLNNLFSVIDISAGKNFTLFLLSGNTITGIGDNTYNQALGGNNLTGVSGIYAGENYGIALLYDGRIVGWGDNTYNQYQTYIPKIYSNDIIYDFTPYRKEGDIRMMGGDYNIGPPVGFRAINYTGIYTGIARFNDYFYDPETATLSFVKDVFYRVEGINLFTPEFNVLNSTSNNQLLPTTAGLLINLSSLSGYQVSTVTTTIYGFIRNYPLKRLQISGFSYLTGTVSGIGTGIINFNRIISGFPSIAYTNQSTGYINATGLLNFNDPELGDFIVLNNDFTGSNVAFVYQTGDNFLAPGFFKNAQDLNNIINSGSGDYGIKSSYFPNFAFPERTFITGDNKLGNSENDFFGRAIHYNNFTKTLFVGAESDINSISNVGAVYIFTGYRNNWNQIGFITGNTFEANPQNDSFGYSISSNLSGNILAIGGYLAEINSIPDVGVVYIFTGRGTDWTQVARVTGDTLGFGSPINDNFGHSISFNSQGNILAVGARFADSNGQTNAGAAYIFTGQGNNWSQIARLTGQRTIPMAPANDQIGFSVSLNSNGDILAAGAQAANPFNITNVGAVFIFTGLENNWNQAALLTGNTFGIGSPINDRFGYSISINSTGNILAVGAYTADTTGVSSAGAVYIFTGSGNSWLQTARLTGNTLGLGDPTNHFFGISTSINSAGNVLAIGADALHVNSIENVGAVYIFTGTPNNWSQIHIFTGNSFGYGTLSGNRFGNKIELNKNGNELFVGAYGGDINGINDAGYINYIDFRERLILESVINGELGNNFRIISQGSDHAPYINNEFLKGGETKRIQITPLSGVIFTGNLNTGMLITGYFEKLITGFIEKQITGLLGYRPFTGLWDLYELSDVSFTNIKNTGYFNESGIYTNYTGFSKDIVNIKRFAVSYTNQPDFESTDVALLNINLNSGFSGLSYNIILTGDTELNTQIIPPTGNAFGVK